MPHSSKKTKKIPVVFEQTISAEEIKKRSLPKKNLPAEFDREIKQKRIWLWSGVTLVMIVILFSWFYYLPQQLKIKSATADLEKNLFSNTVSEFSTIIEEQQTKADDFKKIIGQELESLAAATNSVSSTTSTALTTQQIEELKNKIEKK